mgnify:CR=1 FL=1
MAPPSGGQTHFFFPFEKETVLDAKEKGALTGTLARGAGKRQTASFVFPLCGRSSPGRYGLRGRNRDTAPLHLGDAWRYGELAGCAPAREQGPGGGGVSNRGAEAPYWSFLKGEIPKRGKIEIPLFGPSFRPLSLGRKGTPRRVGPSRQSVPGGRVCHAAAAARFSLQNAAVLI